MKDLIAVLSVIIAILTIMLVVIWNTTYEFCFTTGEDSYQCYYQKIGDYLLGKE